MIHYQGCLTAGGTNFTGLGYFKFALVNRPGNQTFWSSDGTSLGGAEPASPVPLLVTGGLFSVLLGDSSLTNMTPVPMDVFTNQNVFLRIWFDDGLHGSDHLLPDQRLASVGFAMMAANVPDGTVTSAKLAPEAVTGPQIADGSITGLKIASNTVTSAQLADVLDLGSSNVAGRLDIFRTAASTPAISLVGNTSRIVTYGDDGLEQVELRGTAQGELLLHNSLTNNAVAVSLSANGPLGGMLSLNSSNGATRATLAGVNSGGALTLQQADGDIGAQLVGDSGGSGSLQLRNASGVIRLSMHGQSPTSNNGSELTLSDQNGTKTIELLGQSTATTGSRVTLRRGNGTSSVVLDGEFGSGEGGTVDLNNGSGQLRLRLEGDAAEAGRALLYNSEGTNTVDIRGDSSDGGRATFYNSLGSGTVDIQGDSNHAGHLSVRNTNGALRVQLYGVSPTSSSGGEVNLRDSDGTKTVEILGQSSATTGSKLTLTSRAGTTSLVLDGEYGSGEGGAVDLYNDAGALRLHLDGDAQDAGMAVLYNSLGSNTVTIQGDNDDAGRLSLANPSGASRISMDGYGESGGGKINVKDEDGTTTVEIFGAESSTEGAEILLRRLDGTRSVEIDGESTGNDGGVIRLYNKSGNETVVMDGDYGDSGLIELKIPGGGTTITLDANYGGDGRIITQELQITGGSDLSEQFEIKPEATGRAAPGMVVCIDPANPGALQLSRRAYDTTVAGILSGAGGVKPGMLMGQQGSIADGQHPVALTGRAYCWCDAAGGSIQPGDLLTTSDTAGHAMRVKDPARAPGAILGKAMTRLERGRGLVLVLVTLQ
ncbi:MAG: hypothetical protein JXQ71_17545 [Verrucomicrobia bacterium]|nr:hypothetical protein [Verrucomicrobiota bacterium]